MNKDEQNVKNPPNSEDMKKQVGLEDMYAVVNKQQKKEHKEDTPTTHSNTDERVHYNTVKKECALEDEEEAPKIPPHTMEALHTAVVKKPKTMQIQLKKPHLNLHTQIGLLIRNSQ